uniref:Uncharacterized protein n=1 Tax=Opuntia streptacantha TaxID=393608 RepID=A0A7C9CPG0_OPUST
MVHGYHLTPCSLLFLLQNLPFHYYKGMVHGSHLTPCSLLFLRLLYLQNLLHYLLLFNKECSDNPFPNSANRQDSTISTVHSSPVPRQSGPLIFSRSKVRYPLNPLASNRAFRTTSSLLGGLIN